MQMPFCIMLEDLLYINDNIEGRELKKTYAQDDIMKEILCGSKKEKELTNVIISHLEGFICKGFHENKIMLLPTLGSIRRNIVTNIVLKNLDNINHIRKTLSKQEAKEVIDKALLPYNKYQFKLKNKKYDVIIRKENKEFLKGKNRTYRMLFTKFRKAMDIVPKSVEPINNNEND